MDGKQSHKGLAVSKYINQWISVWAVTIYYFLSWMTWRDVSYFYGKNIGWNYRSITTHPDFRLEGSHCCIQIKGKFLASFIQKMFIFKKKCTCKYFEIFLNWERYLKYYPGKISKQQREFGGRGLLISLAQVTHLVLG